MEPHRIIDVLKEREKAYLETSSFSNQPGIYAFFFIGSQLPLIGDAVKKHDIIYIGKTESSQEKRDAKTHFTSGKTGSSTVRKSIGSILCAEYELKPIPRNDSDYSKGRLSHFRFDHRSEEIITDWMKSNLALSFYEFHGTKEEIEGLETYLIHQLIPVLNISKNFLNPYRETLKQLRENCALMARNSNDSINTKPISNNYKPIKPYSMVTSGKYIDLWSSKRVAIKDKLLNSQFRQSIQLNPEDFRRVGNRNRYAFNLEFSNGVVSNNVGGSAVARDLAKVLQNSSDIMEVLKEGYYKINMDGQFRLWVQKMG